MKKNDTKTDMSWDIPEEEYRQTSPNKTEATATVAAKTEVKADVKVEKTAKVKPVAPTPVELQFDIEGLMTDFPTAKDLERFVYDQTGYILNLKGRANAVKYKIAMDTLNGLEPDEKFLTQENPWLDKAELVPADPLKPVPARDPAIAKFGPEVNIFDTNMFPHPDPEWRAQDKKATVTFRKYANGAITYEIIGPIAQRAVGVKINKFGAKVPEKYTWVDPRTGEQVIRHGDGSYTALGTRLRGFMRKQRFNKTNQWDVWIDRDFVVSEDYIDDNPWNVK